MLTFAQPYLLLALGGLIIPVLIHRISRSRPVPWHFPSISKIRQSPLPRHGTRSLTDLLLLLLRMLLLALLICALAGPYWQSGDSGATASANRESNTVIVVDFSSSMSGWGGSRQTREFIEAINPDPGETVGWVVHAAGVLERQTPADGRQSIDQLLSYLDENDSSLAAGTPSVAIREAMTLLGSLPRRKVIIVSDFQSSDWSDTLPYIPDSVELELHRVGQDSRDQNVSIVQAQTVPTGRERIRVLAEVMNHGSAVVEIVAALELPAQVISREVSLEPGKRTPVVFELSRPEGTDSARLDISHEGDPYSRDNSTWFSISPPPPLNILALNPEDRTAPDEELFFIDQALQIASNNEWIQFSLLPAGPESINPETLERAAGIIISSGNAASKLISWEDLKGYVEQGGLLLVTLGENAVRATMEMGRADLELGDYIGLAARDRFTRHHVASVPEGSPLSDVFRGPAERDLFLLTIRQYARINPTPESLILLESESGDALLWSIPIGKGNLVVSAFPWDRMASDFPLRPSFLPIVREVMGFSLLSGRDLSGEAYQSPVPVSESLTTIIPVDALETRLRGGRASAWEGGQVASPAAADGATLPLAPWLLMAACLVWLIESLLAARLTDAPQTKGRDA